MRLLALLGVLLLLGCSQASPSESFVAFQVVGDGHQSKPATMALQGGQIVLSGQAPAGVELSAATSAAALDAVLGQSLPVTGTLRLPSGQTLKVVRGNLMVQNLQDGVARGNFEVICQPTGPAPATDKPLQGDLDVRGSFDAATP